MERQFTSTCYLVDQNKFLLLFHPKHQRWLPPGGHREDNETPPETARREVLEETGLEIAFIHDETIWVDEWNATSIERPHAVLLESLPATQQSPAHEHIDFIYVARPISGNLTHGKWFTLEKVEALTTHEEIFFDTKEIIKTLAQKQLVV